MQPIRWQLGHGIRVAMSVAADGDLRAAAGRSSWCSRNGIPVPAVPRQVHGCAILPAHADGEAGDGMVAAGPGACLAAFGADCPSLVLAAADALAVAHCGWRGCAAGIVGALAEAMAGMSRHPPGRWEAFIGPGVHPADYEVDGPVLDARVWPAGCLASGRPDRAWLDLPSAIAADCRAAGIGQVARTPLTTSRDARLHSHRRAGPGPPQLLVAWRSACAG